MLRSLKDLESYQIKAMDGDVGKVTDFLFDDLHWTTRYLVTDTRGVWDAHNQVLISPISFHQSDWTTHAFHIGLTQAKVKASPRLDLNKPVSREYEQDYARYYGWPSAWGFGSAWPCGPGDGPLPRADSLANQEPGVCGEDSADPHLRSAQEVASYHVTGSDGEIGHVADFIIDDETWAIRYLVIDTNNWWFDNKVLVAPHWATSIRWAEKMVYLNLTKDAIKNSPPWNAESLVTRNYEERLYNYYGRTVYWPSSEAATKDKISGIMSKPEHRFV